VLVVDDSTLDKPYAHKTELVHRHWSGKHHAVVSGINLITLVWGALSGFDSIFGMFDALGDWRIADGKLTPMATSPQRQEALKFINQMVQAGVLDPD